MQMETLLLRFHMFFLLLGLVGDAKTPPLAQWWNGQPFVFGANAAEWSHVAVQSAYPPLLQRKVEPGGVAAALKKACLNLGWAYQRRPRSRYLTLCA